MSPTIFPMHFFSRAWKPSVLALRVPDSFLALCKFFNSAGVSATCLCLAATSLHVKALFFNMLRGPCLQVSRTMVRGLYFLWNTLHSSLGDVYFSDDLTMRSRGAVEHPLSLWFSVERENKEKALAICSAIDGECHQIQTKHVWIPSMTMTVTFWSPVKNGCSLHESNLKHSHFSMQMAIFFRYLFSSGWALPFIDTCKSHPAHIVTIWSILPPDCQEALWLFPDMFCLNKSPRCCTCSEELDAFTECQLRDFSC